MVFESIKRPFTDFKKLIIGIILGIIPIVNFLVLGYILDAAKKAKKKNFELPEWKNFGELFVNGFFSLLIQIIYFIPVGIVIFLMAGSYFGDLQGMNNLMSGFSGISIVIIGILSLVLYFFASTGIMFFVKDYKFTDAFRLGDIAEKLSHQKYVTQWILGCVFMLIIYLIFVGVPGVGGGIPFVGSGITLFIGDIIFFSLIGEAFGEK